MKETRQTNFTYPIIYTKILEDRKLVVVDSHTTVRFLNIDDLKVLGGFKAKIDHERYKQNIVSFSPSGDKFSVLTADCREARLFNSVTKKNIAKMTRHQGEVSTVIIDPLNRYMFSGGEDGKTFVVDLKTGKLAFTLPHHADTINEIAFSPNGNWCVTVSYDRKVGVFNIATMTPKHKLKNHSAPVMKASFIGASRFVSIDKNSVAIVWDTYSARILARLHGIHDEVREIVVTKDEKFLFLGTQLGHIIVYELEKYTQLSRSLIKYKCAVTALEFDNEENNLIVGTDDGGVHFYDIYQGAYKLKELLQNKEYAEIYRQADKNPFLIFSQPYKLVDSLWEKSLKKVKPLLEAGETKKALSLLDNFKNIPLKNSYIQKLISEYKDFDKFSNLVKQGKYALAYSMINTNPTYKETKIYKSLEKMWQKNFVQAQKYALTPGGMEKAKDLLAPYRGVSEKTKHIQELLTEGKIYKRFRVSLANKNFKIVYELIKQHPFLKEFPEFEILEEYGVKLYIQAENLIKKGDINSALETLKILSDFNEFKEEAQQLKEDIENKIKFEEAIKNNDISSAYKLLDLSDDLQETKEGKELFDKWNADVEKANGFAALGDVHGVQRSLKDYMNIHSKHISIGSVIAWCYVTQLEQAVRAKKDQGYIETGIKNYILHFGLRDEIESFYNIFCMYYKESKLNLEMLHKGSMKMWKPTMIVDSILGED